MADPSNPFSGIFASAEAVGRQMSAVEEQRREIGDALARVFLCTPTSSVEGRPSRPRCLVALPQLARDLERMGKTAGHFDLDSVAKVWLISFSLSLPLTHTRTHARTHARTHTRTHTHTPTHTHTHTHTP